MRRVRCYHYDLLIICGDIHGYVRQVLYGIPCAYEIFTKTSGLERVIEVLKRSSYMCIRIFNAHVTP